MCVQYELCSRSFLVCLFRHILDPSPPACSCTYLNFCMQAVELAWPSIEGVARTFIRSEPVVEAAARLWVGAIRAAGESAP